MAGRTENLHIDMPGVRAKAAKSKVVADSWEDEDADLDAMTPTDPLSPSLQPVQSNAGPSPPPPTPIFPSSGQSYDWAAAGVLGGGRPQPRSLSGQDTPRSESERRPEKTTAAASRMIAAGLGVKAPKKTEEQRQYDRATREQEIKRKNREKEERERERREDERAKAAVWDA
ncbi:uncharacterized protein HMPREF1541_08733 [Cyphellophora europaea CBS 101466]|uniref:Uncharacterized protein n=1 Tax=Cyphellophora europaea (strain CBS 101466) TaxID=1220924 RepID=W2RJF2_CYPE1|nr:uncharacterized protein HMPREF1541_08733 [Cyphellophora europaea CBS 101466]ETN36455.1 hypothetical protein HMPREF1541_08733 [Cyphellophora europaea CBS 101466]